MLSASSLLFSSPTIIPVNSLSGLLLQRLLRRFRVVCGEHFRRVRVSSRSREHTLQTSCVCCHWRTISRRRKAETSTMSTRGSSHPVSPRPVPRPRHEALALSAPQSERECIIVIREQLTVAAPLRGLKAIMKLPSRRFLWVVRSAFARSFPPGSVPGRRSPAELSNIHYWVIRCVRALEWLFVTRF